MFGFVAGVEEVGEGEGGRFGAEEWTGGEVDDLLEGGEGGEVGDHGVGFGGVGVGFDFEEDDVFDKLLRRGGRGGGGGHFEWGGEVGLGEAAEGEVREGGEREWWRR